MSLVPSGIRLVAFVFFWGCTIVHLGRYASSGGDWRDYSLHADPLRFQSNNMRAEIECISHLPLNVRCAVWDIAPERRFCAVSTARSLAPFVRPRILLPPHSEEAWCNGIFVVRSSEVRAWKAEALPRSPSWRRLHASGEGFDRFELWASAEVSDKESAALPEARMERGAILPLKSMLFALTVSLASMIVLLIRAPGSRGQRITGVVMVFLVWAALAVMCWVEGDLGNAGFGLWGASARFVAEDGLLAYMRAAYQEQSWILSGDYPPLYPLLVGAFGGVDDIFDWRICRLVCLAIWPWTILVTSGLLADHLKSHLLAVSFAICLFTSPVAMEAVRHGLPDLLMWTLIMASAWGITRKQSFWKTASLLLIMSLCKREGALMGSVIVTLAVLYGYYSTFQAGWALVGVGSWMVIAKLMGLQGWDFQFSLGMQRTSEEVIRIYEAGVNKLSQITYPFRYPGGAAGVAMIPLLACSDGPRKHWLLALVLIILVSLALPFLFCVSAYGNVDAIIDHHMAPCFRLSFGLLLLSIAAVAYRDERLKLMTS